MHAVLDELLLTWADFLMTILQVNVVRQVSKKANVVFQPLREISKSSTMSNSKFEYVRQFELDDRLLPNSWIVVRIDGKAFHKFSDVHSFAKPNDKRALDLMNASARQVMKEFVDLVLAYGQSDEYSFVFRKDTQLYSRRSSKLMTNIVSSFASNYVYRWHDFFGADEQPLKYAPTFDARTVLYPTNKNLRDYLSWRQVDCHINNLYNTTFWTLIQKGGLTNSQAETRLKGTYSADKNEILFSQFGINYNDEPDQFKKGTVIFRKRVDLNQPDQATPHGIDMKQGKIKERLSREEYKELRAQRIRSVITEANSDIIGDTFWEENPHLLEPFKDS